MKIKIYQLDAFTDSLFGGNPAAVCPLIEWLPDALLQNIAMENNLAETAFIVKESNGYRIRWFTPAVEVDLCGHATLAAAYVLFHLENYQGNEIEFQSRSGLLRVINEHDMLTLNFPVDKLEEVDISSGFLSCFDIAPIKVYKGKSDFMFVFENESQIANIQPDLHRISELDARGVIITAKGDHVDFVSRFFAPQSGIDEDPVTGSAHTSLTPYWHEVLQKDEMTAIQLSKRKGFLKCKYLGERIAISGKVCLYMSGEIILHA
jgi:PhzF family phenazine biosynthesis protein